MNNIDEMPPKCQNCPYWETCKTPHVCQTQMQANKRGNIMTREEAIQALKKLKMHVRFNSGLWDDTKFEACKAIEMAIGALSPNDIVDDIGNYMKGYRDGLKDAESAIHDKLRSL